MPNELLLAIGFWRSQESPISFPHPCELISCKWDSEERIAIADYLSRGVSLRGYFGYSYCRFSNGPPDEEMGTDDFTDGTWVWPQALAFYVSNYSVRLPEEFLSHAKSLDYNVPTNLDIHALRQRKYSYRFWIRWSRKRRSNLLLAIFSFVTFGL